jgi:RNA 2',3'-cyclic 3'-phosphodiesterase
MKIRSFLAFDIPEPIKAELAEVIGVLSPRIRDVRWIKPEYLHCTLRFFGNVEEELLHGKLSEMIAREVLHQSPVRMSCSGLGVFPNWRYPRILWAGIGGDTESVISLHAKLEDAFEEFGFEKDPRLLRLHLTLGRSRGPFRECEGLMNLVEKMAEKDFGEFDMKGLVLYKSVLSREGAIYTPLRSFPLGGAKR